VPDGEPVATRSRRRGDELISAIHAAVLAELDAHGYAGMTMEGVAERAGAGKASLYRRWSSRAELVRDTAYHLMQDSGGVPDTGTLEGDLRELLTQTAQLLAGPLGEALRALLSEALAERSRSGELSSLSLGMGRRMMREVVQRAVARGEIAEHTVTDTRLDVGQALMRDRFLFRRVSEQDVDEIVDSVLVPLLRAPAASAPT